MPPGDSADEEAYTLARALEVAGWPASLAAPAKAPHVIRDLLEFEDEVLFGVHINRVVVLPGGVAKLGHGDALPAYVCDAAHGETSVTAFLERLGDDEHLRTLRGRVYCTPPGSRDERELKENDGTTLDTLDQKRAALRERENDGCDVYLAELRRAAKYRHGEDGRWAKTVLARDVYDWVGKKRARAMPYWDRYDEGVFVGARLGGSPMHVDQCIWSNVGKNFAGYKLVAVWPYGERSRADFDEHAYSLFVPPLSASESACLERATSVALLGPGDVVVFSGGNAHMALSVSTALSITAYESFINLCPRNLEAFLDSGTADHYRQCRTRQSMLEDIKGDVADAMCDLAEDVRDGVLRDDDLEAAAPAAVAALRRDTLLAKKVPPMPRPTSPGSSARSG